MGTRGPEMRNGRTSVRPCSPWLGAPLLQPILVDVPRLFVGRCYPLRCPLANLGEPPLFSLFVPYNPLWALIRPAPVLFVFGFSVFS